LHGNVLPCFTHTSFRVRVFTWRNPKKLPVGIRRNNELSRARCLMRKLRVENTTGYSTALFIDSTYSQFQIIKDVLACTFTLWVWLKNTVPRETKEWSCLQRQQSCSAKRTKILQYSNQIIHHKYIQIMNNQHVKKIHHKYIQISIHSLCKILSTQWFINRSAAPKRRSRKPRITRKLLKLLVPRYCIQGVSSHFSM